MKSRLCSMMVPVTRPMLAQIRVQPDHGPVALAQGGRL
jgi:hypothetical protein